MASAGCTTAYRRARALVCDNLCSTPGPEGPVGPAGPEGPLGPVRPVGPTAPVAPEIAEDLRLLRFVIYYTCCESNSVCLCSADLTQP